MDERMAALRDMQSRDPDGRETRPTQQDYAAFERWAVSTYGERLYWEYTRGGWGSAPEV